MAAASTVAAAGAVKALQRGAGRVDRPSQGQAGLSCLGCGAVSAKVSAFREVSWNGCSASTSSSFYRSTRRQLRAGRSGKGVSAGGLAQQVDCVLDQQVKEPGLPNEEQLLQKSEEIAEGIKDSLSVLGSRIWLSDVVEKKRRPYFLGREWTQKDLTYAGYMVFVHALCLTAPFCFSWDAFGAFAVLYIITGMLGITLSFHRHLSHKSFKLPKWLEYTFAYCGVQAVQGDPLEWVSAHRYHHQHCDTPQDPHTPYEGFWHSHMGWLLDDKATTERVGARANIADMVNDPFYKFIEKTYPLHIFGMAALLYALGGWPYIVWGMAVRVVWVYHITWAVNSAAHVWGSQSWNTGDLSRNNWWVALLAFGEGWHNNHHAFEYSARHGLEWWQFDLTWYTVKALEAVGLATKVRYPTKEHMSRLAPQKS